MNFEICEECSETTGYFLRHKPLALVDARDRFVLAALMLVVGGWLLEPFVVLHRQIPDGAAAAVVRMMFGSALFLAGLGCAAVLAYRVIRCNAVGWRVFYFMQYRGEERQPYKLHYHRTNDTKLYVTSAFVQGKVGGWLRPTRVRIALAGRDRVAACSMWHYADGGRMTIRMKDGRVYRDDPWRVLYFLATGKFSTV